MSAGLWHWRAPFDRSRGLSCWAPPWASSCPRPYHYKPFAVWVFALDPRGPHNQPDEGPPGNHANLEYNYDVVIARGSSGVVIEEAMGWDKSLPLLSPVKTAHK